MGKKSIAKSDSKSKLGSTLVLLTLFCIFVMTLIDVLAYMAYKLFPLRIQSDFF